MNSHVLIPVRAKKVVQKNLARYTDNCGSQVRSGRRQSMPSSNIDNCARVSETVPLVACGHTKRPRSNRFANRHNPSPSYQRTLIRSPRRPRNTNTCPENGFCSSLVSTSALSPVKPRRKSVTPAAIQIRVLAGDADHRSQALQQHPHQCRIGAAFDAHLRLPQFDVNRARLWFRKIGGPAARPAKACGKLSLTRTGSNFIAGLRSPSLPAR